MTLRSALKRHWRVAALILSGLLGVLIGISGAGRGFDEVFRETSAQILKHPAGGTLHIVEIDAGSIAAIDHWPWPRRNYAELVDRLRQAGANSIVFDVDFSSKADPRDDLVFAAALDRARGKVVLPTFGQRIGGGHQGWTDSLPIPALRDHAALAAVSILPDDDGVVRRAPIGTMTAGLPRPSLSATLGGVDGAADQDFPIDFAIDPKTIPRHSFVDIRDGRFDPADIRGKDILIGATAIEVGDRYAVPNYGVIPGVVVQALAAETLSRGMPREGGWPLPVLFALNLAWLILHLRGRRSLLAAVAASLLIVTVLTVAVKETVHLVFPIVPALAVLLMAIGIKYAIHSCGAARHRRTHDRGTGLPNRSAMKGASQPSSSGVVAARFTDYDKLLLSLGDAGIGDLVRRVHERIALVSEGPVFRVEDRALAWFGRNADHVEASLETLRIMMLNPVEVGGRRVDVTMSYGFANRPRAEEADYALMRALLAADRAIEQDESWHLYDERDDEAVDYELSLLSELDEAIVKGEIVVAYQPKLCLKTDRIASVEALVRWNHPTRGRLGPDQFIPLAERSDRIASLTLHVLKRTIRDLGDWHAQGYPISGAVNLSAKLLTSQTFLSDVRGIVTEASVPADMLAFEVTESATMTDAIAAAAALQSFQAMGIEISIDDYGTGQSTLSYLKQLPLNELKIDRSFVQFAHQNRSDGVLVQSTINLAHELGLKVVAEGVETAECLNFLHSKGCDLVQGYHVSRPVSPEEIFAILRRSHAAAA